tara:strand:+ start:81 stop:704 length:624 start_codon:yes stop_codon:yes gene_type:complete
MVIKAHQFRSELTVSPYAPSWDYLIAEKKIDVDLDELSRLILDNASVEYEITVAPNCKSYFFNVLKWDYPVCKQLHKQIIEFHDEYVQGTRKPRLNNLKIRCWANVMSKGDKIGKHHHGSFSHSYLSGNFAIKCEDTSTNYYHPYDNNEMYPIKNQPGHMHLFPSWLPHDTSMHNGNSERIIIAFDIYIQDSPLLSSNHSNQLIDLR